MLTKGEAGIASLKSFTESGGTIVALHNASQVYAKKDSAVVNVTDTFDEKDFYIPGSILEVAVDNTNPIAFGSTPTAPIFFELSPSFKVSGGAKSIATYDKDNPLLSGWILGGKYLKRALLLSLAILSAVRLRGGFTAAICVGRAICLGKVYRSRSYFRPASSSVLSRLAAGVSLSSRFPAPWFAMADGRCVLVKLWTGSR